MSLLLLFLTSCLAFVTAFFDPPLSIEFAEFHFERFIQQYERQYADEVEKQARFQIFKDNLALAISLNEAREYDNYGITIFSDLSLEEFHQLYTGFLPSLESDQCTQITDDQIKDVNAPESFDWRDHNAVTAVKKQKCRDCYTFSSVGNIEGQYAIKTKKLVDLSSQQIIDCDNSDGGCRGGQMRNVFSSLMESGGSESLADYPYVGKQMTCRFNPSKVKVKVAGCHTYNLKSQEKLKQLLYQNGPISIGIRSYALSLHAKGGLVLDKECQQGILDHAVLLVGYGQDNETGQQYWIAKNSWGPQWGEHGYFRMQRGENAFSCGMMNPDMASAVIA